MRSRRREQARERRGQDLPSPRRALGRIAVRRYESGSAEAHVHLWHDAQEVREKMTALQWDMDRGGPAAWGAVDRRGHLGHWLENVVRPNKAPKTCRAYELVVRRHIGPVLGRKRLRALGMADVRDLVARLEEQGMGTRGIQQAHAVLRNALQSAMRDEVVIRNVAKLVQVKIHSPTR